MKLHIIEGEPGCIFAREHGHVAVVVDALRASATAAMLLDAGASELVVVREVEEAFALKKTYPDALLFGERGGLPPEGFDFGNSPRTVHAARARRVIFTTTTGAQRLVSSWECAGLFMGSTVNASAVARLAAKASTRHGADVVLIPAGLASDPDFDAQEDWVAATVIALRFEAEVVSGADPFEYWKAKLMRNHSAPTTIDEEAVKISFHAAPHAEKLRMLGLEADIDFCARVDTTNTVPEAVERMPLGVVCVPAKEELKV